MTTKRQQPGKDAGVADAIYQVLVTERDVDAALDLLCAALDQGPDDVVAKAWERRRIVAQLARVPDAALVWDLIGRYEGRAGERGQPVHDYLLRFHLISLLGGVVRVNNRRLLAVAWNTAGKALRAHAVEAIHGHHAHAALALSSRDDCSEAWRTTSTAHLTEREMQRKPPPTLRALMSGAYASLVEMALWASEYRCADV